MRYDDLGAMPGVSDRFLADTYNMLDAVLDQHVPALRKQSLGPEARAGDGPPIRLPELGPEPPGATADPAKPGRRPGRRTARSSRSTAPAPGAGG